MISNIIESVLYAVLLSMMALGSIFMLFDYYGSRVSVEDSVLYIKIVSSSAIILGVGIGIVRKVT